VIYKKGKYRLCLGVLDNFASCSHFDIGFRLWKLLRGQIRNTHICGNDFLLGENSSAIFFSNTVAVGLGEAFFVSPNADYSHEKSDIEKILNLLFSLEDEYTNSALKVLSSKKFQTEAP